MNAAPKSSFLLLRVTAAVRHHAVCAVHKAPWPKSSSLDATAPLRGLDQIYPTHPPSAATGQRATFPPQPRPIEQEEREPPCFLPPDGRASAKDEPPPPGSQYPNARFLWICPYNAIKFFPRKSHIMEDTSRQARQVVVSEGKGIAAIPGSPDRATALHKRLTKTEADILSLKTRVACERASWERRFAELRRKQEELLNQLACQAGELGRVGRCKESEECGVDNGELFEDCPSDLSGRVYQRRGSEVLSGGDACAERQLSLSLSSRTSSSSATRCWRTSKGPHRVFVPHSPMDLELGHRVRVMLPSGRTRTGTIRFLGHLQGEADLHLGVELQTPDHGLHGGSHKGRSYFKCEPGCGAFVPFHKLLMAWE